MMQVYIEKAFDRVLSEVLFSILNHMGAGSVVLEGVRMASHNCTTSLIINKSVTQRIPVTFFVRQRCHLSQLLSAFYIEPFLLRIIRDPSVRGFTLNTSEFRILAYANDIAIFCTDRKNVKKWIKSQNPSARKLGAT